MVDSVEMEALLAAAAAAVVVIVAVVLVALCGDSVAVVICAARAVEQWQMCSIVFRSSRRAAAHPTDKSTELSDGISLCCH